MRDDEELEGKPGDSSAVSNKTTTALAGSMARSSKGVTCPLLHRARHQIRQSMEM